MSSVLTCTTGNTVDECTAYTEQFFDQVIVAHNNFTFTENQLFVLCLFIGLLLGFLITYLIVYFYKL